MGFDDKLQQYQRIHGADALPGFTQVLTRPGGPIALSAEARDRVAAIETGPGTAAIVVLGDSSRDSYEVMTLQSLLRAKRYAVAAHYVAPGPVFSTLNGYGKVEAAAAGPADNADSVHLFDTILEAGIGRGATDIHICLRESSASIIIRRDGFLIHTMTESRDKVLAAIGVAYNKLALEESRSKAEPQFSERRNQYAMIDRQVCGARWRLRYQSVVVEGGFDVVLRVLRGEAVAVSMTMADLGYENSQEALLNLALMKAVGAIFVAGETGSGKSTTLVTLMTLDPARKAYKSYSIEDPVEYRIYGVSQMPVRRDITLAEDTAPFSEAMRVLMRADPDTIMVGEIRDKDTADVFAPAVQSGHRVLTTVHAASAIGIIDRLSSAPIRMPRSVLAGKRFISALIYQSLLPTLCPDCCRPAKVVMPARRLQLMESKFQVGIDGLRVISEKGCGRCHNGRRGQTVAAEIILPDSEMLRMFRDGLDVEAERRWRETRRAGFADSDMTGKTAFEHGLYKCLQGRIDPRDLEHAFESLWTYEVVGAAP